MSAPIPGLHLGFNFVNIEKRRHVVHIYIQSVIVQTLQTECTLLGADLEKLDWGGPNGALTYVCKNIHERIILTPSSPPPVSSTMTA